MKIRLITSALVLALSSAQAWSSPADSAFVAKAAKGGATEVEAGKLAQAKGREPSVKEFGQHMVTDHTKASAELEKAAQDDSVAIPADARAPDAAALAKISKLEGQAFDEATR